MSTFQWALFAHVSGVFLLVGGMLVSDVAALRARRTEALREVVALLSVVRSGDLLANVGATIVLVFGLWLVHLGGYGYGDAWVVAALALFLGQGAVTAFIAGRRKRAHALARELLAHRQETSSEPASLHGDEAILSLVVLQNVITVTILVLMVWRPGA